MTALVNPTIVIDLSGHTATATTAVDGQRWHSDSTTGMRNNVAVA